MIRLALTPDGEATLAAAAVPAAVVLEDSVGVLGVGEAATLTALLKRLRGTSP